MKIKCGSAEWSPERGRAACAQHPGGAPPGGHGSGAWRPATGFAHRTSRCCRDRGCDAELGSPFPARLLCSGCRGIKRGGGSLTERARERKGTIFSTVARA